jgi:hypothetical protein
MNPRIKELAEQANITLDEGFGWWVAYEEELERFAELVEAAAVAKEREACAKLCEEQYEYYGHDHIFAAKIRARSEK